MVFGQVTVLFVENTHEHRNYDEKENEGSLPPSTTCSRFQLFLHVYLERIQSGVDLLCHLPIKFPVDGTFQVRYSE